MGRVYKKKSVEKRRCSQFLVNLSQLHILGVVDLVHANRPVLDGTAVRPGLFSKMVAAWQAKFSSKSKTNVLATLPSWIQNNYTVNTTRRFTEAGSYHFNVEPLSRERRDTQTE